MMPDQNRQLEDCALVESEGYPVGYFITFRCYGTWLHGDPRGAMDRDAFHAPGTPFMPASPTLSLQRREALRHEPASLGLEERAVVVNAIADVCRHRGWSLHVVEPRTEHVHIVVSGRCRPEVMMTTFKAWCTRNLRSAGLLGRDAKIWSRHGSTRYLWTDQAMQEACRYAVEAQEIARDG